MGSTLGAMKSAATKAGVTLEEYQARQSQGLRWCCGCKSWHPSGQFATDNSRHGGLACTCRAWRNRTIKRAKRAPEKVRARNLVAMRVRRGRIPHPSTLPCSKCQGYQWESGKRHEYHHHMGYSEQHKGDVIVLCSTCHSQEDK